MEKPGDVEAAWAAGFFDGEGSFCFGHQSGIPAVWVTIGNTYRPVLDRFAAATKVGAVYGPYPTKGNRQPIYRYVASGIAAVETVGSVVLPFLSPQKREQYESAVESFAAHRRPTRAEINRDKTHCHRGHPFAGENLYVAPNGYRSCRTCRRERHHARKAGVAVR